MTIDTRELTRRDSTTMTFSKTQTLVPKDFTEAVKIAELLSKSNIVPKEFVGNQANILLAIMFGNEIGLAPAQALQNIMVVNGRPSLWGDAVMGKVKASGVYEASKDSFDEKSMTATFEVKRKGEDWVTRTFSQADAQKAGLWGKQGPWTGYPKRMLFNRARAWALRDTFPDVLKGLRITEEEQDVIDITPVAGESAQTPTYAMPKAITEAQAVAETQTQEAEASSNGDSKPMSWDATFTVDSVARTEKDGEPAFVIYSDGRKTKYYTKDEKMATFAKEHAGQKVNAMFASNGKGYVIEMQGAEPVGARAQ